MEVRGFRLSRSKIEYMECKFSKKRNNEQGIIILDGQQIPKVNNLERWRD